MATITVFYALHCQEEQFLTRLQEKTQYKLVRDAEVIARAEQLSGLRAERLQKAFSAKTSLFNPFTHEKEKALAYLTLAAAEFAQEDRIIIAGYSSQLLAVNIAHILKLCLVADIGARIQFAAEAGEKEATKTLHKNDAEKAAWVLEERGVPDPWSPSLYDMVLPMDKNGVEETVQLVDEQLDSKILQPTKASRQKAADLLTQARVEMALALEGHEIQVQVQKGIAQLTIEKNVLMLNRLKQELEEIVAKVEGVNKVDIGIGKDFYQADIYRKVDFQAPAKVLLVDDEREFVQTLSERLLLRDIGSAVVYDGESALEMLAEDEPEVMLLDLKMPGIDGMEVLKRVKATRPSIEVIILTGHGNESDREACMALGAFAYLQKPVDIEVLSETMKKANDRVIERRQGQGN